NLNQPLYTQGMGKITFGDGVSIGERKSPYFLNGNCFLSARNTYSEIRISANTKINNNFCIISESEGVMIGENCLIGLEVKIYDSDFHSINPKLRGNVENVQKKRIIIGDNVFIGSNVTILKGVS